MVMALSLARSVLSFVGRRERRCALAHIEKSLDSESSLNERPREHMVPQVISALLAFLLFSEAAHAHDIYTHLKSRSGKSCCDIRIAVRPHLRPIICRACG
jgi:hypothetical protein